MISFNHLLGIAFIFVVYRLGSYHNQEIYLSRELLNREKELNQELENRIRERTDSLVKANRSLVNVEKLDALTGVVNRTYFLKLLNDTVEEGAEFSLLIIDIKKLKMINDLHGMVVGDKLIQQVAKRLKLNESKDFKVGRLNGDEFAVIISATDAASVEGVGESIDNQMIAPVIVDDFQFKVDITIGIARYPYDAEKTEELLKFGYLSMHHAKHLGQNYSRLVKQEALIRETERRNYIEMLLDTEKFNEEFCLYYQPQFDVSTDELIGMEALIRWQHGDEGVISPLEFISIAEETGIIVPMSYWIFEQAMKQIKFWNSKYGTEHTMAINLSSSTLDHIELLHNLNRLIKDIGVSPKVLDFEIKEHRTVNTSMMTEHLLNSLDDMGASVSIDDFGPGYLSLKYIQRYHVDKLKIAKELISGVDTSHNDWLIVNAIIKMSSGLGIKTIAEGVETEGQLKVLRELGCDQVQGFLKGKPVSADEFEKTYLKFRKSAIYDVAYTE